MPISSIEIRGLIETRAKMEQVVSDLHGPPMVSAMQAAVLLVQRDAALLAPVDTGRLRASITSEIRQPVGTGDVLGVVGSNVEQAAPMELGAKPHWPPRAALETWAQRHGINVFVVMRAIAKKGLKPRRYLQGAVEKNKAAIIRIIEDGVKGIVEK